MKFLIISILLFIWKVSSFAQNNSYKNLIIGNWKYNVAYDTLAAVVDTSHFYGERTEVYFFEKIKFKKKSAKLIEFDKIWNVKWNIINFNELIFYLNDKKTLKYQIIRLSRKNLEISEFGTKIRPIGYFK